VYINGLIFSHFELLACYFYNCVHVRKMRRKLSTFLSKVQSFPAKCPISMQIKLAGGSFTIHKAANCGNIHVPEHERSFTFELQ
jgi:hypothetical protein